MGFFDWKGIVHHEFVPCGQMVNRQLYQAVLARLREALRRKRPELWENQTWILNHNNAPAQASLLIRSYLTKRQTSIVPHPTYSPDLAPADVFLFPKLKNHFERTSFPNHRGDSGKCDNRTARHHRKCIPASIPTLEEKLGMVSRQ